MEIYAGIAAELRRRVEKPNPSSELTERDKGAARQRMVTSAGSSAIDVSRSETPEQAASPIFGPSCGFMAQIIAQVLANNRVDLSYAARAYSVNHAAPNAISRIADSI